MVYSRHLPGSIWIWITVAFLIGMPVGPHFQWDELSANIGCFARPVEVPVGPPAGNGEVPSSNSAAMEAIAPTPTNAPDDLLEEGSEENFESVDVGSLQHSPTPEPTSAVPSITPSPTLNPLALFPIATNILTATPAKPTSLPNDFGIASSPLNRNCLGNDRTKCVLNCRTKCKNIRDSLRIECESQCFRCLSQCPKFNATYNKILFNALCPRQCLTSPYRS
jgi:hypothetical protein